MANIENLIPVTERTPEERKALAKKAGIASGAARRRKRTFKEEFIAFLENGDTQEKITLAQIQKALEGDTRAFETIRDTIGEKPVDKIEAEVNSEINITIE